MTTVDQLRALKDALPTMTEAEKAEALDYLLHSDAYARLLRCLGEFHILLDVRTLPEQLMADLLDHLEGASKPAAPLWPPAVCGAPPQEDAE